MNSNIQSPTTEITKSVDSTRGSSDIDSNSGAGSLTSSEVNSDANWHEAQVNQLPYYAGVPVMPQPGYSVWSDPALLNWNAADAYGDEGPAGSAWAPQEVISDLPMQLVAALAQQDVQSAAQNGSNVEHTRGRKRKTLRGGLTLEVQMENVKRQRQSLAPTRPSFDQISLLTLPPLLVPLPQPSHPYSLPPSPKDTPLDTLPPPSTPSLFPPSPPPRSQNAGRPHPQVEDHNAPRTMQGVADDIQGGRPEGWDRRASERVMEEEVDFVCNYEVDEWGNRTEAEDDEEVLARRWINREFNNELVYERDEEADVYVDDEVFDWGFSDDEEDEAETGENDRSREMEERPREAEEMSKMAERRGGPL